MNFRLPYPLMLWLEPSANCNLDCPECPTATSRKGGQMELAQFVYVIDQIPWLRLVNLWFRGEPLLAPELPDMVAEATRRGIFSQTHTNGILLTHRDTAARLVEAGLTRIAIGIDGPDETGYQLIRSGGLLKEVEAGVRALAEARRRLGKRKPRIIAECLLSRQTPDERHSVHELARDWGCDEVKFKTFKVPSPDNWELSRALLPDNQALWRYDRVDGRLVMRRKTTSRGCRRLSYSAVVGWDGEVYPCCFWLPPPTPPYNSRGGEGEGMGNAFNQPWREIWRGEPLRQVQSAVNADRDKIPICRNCTEGLKRLYVLAREVIK